MQSLYIFLITWIIRYLLVGSIHSKLGSDKAIRPNNDLIITASF